MINNEQRAHDLALIHVETRFRAYLSLLKPDEPVSKFDFYKEYKLAYCKYLSILNDDLLFINN